MLDALKGRAGIEAARTDHPFHAAELAAEAARAGARLVVAVGGDGTANEAANGLAGTRTALWCLPGGSTNVFARTMGAPTRLGPAAEQLAARIAAPQIAPTTTGTVDDRHFLFMSGIGVTAEMMRRVAARPALRARLGAGYVAVGAAVALAEAGRGRLPRLVVEADGQQRRGRDRDHPALRPADLLRPAGRSASARPRTSATARCRSPSPIAPPRATWPASSCACFRATAAASPSIPRVTAVENLADAARLLTRRPLVRDRGRRHLRRRRHVGAVRRRARFAARRPALTRPGVRWVPKCPDAPLSG